MSQKYLALCVVAVQLMYVAGFSADAEAFLKQKTEQVIHPLEISLIGAVNGKTFFIEEDVLRTQVAARTYCRTLGMNLAKFENQLELDFVNANVASKEDYFWTDGEIVLTTSSFRWTADMSTIDPNLIIEDGTTVPLGITVSRYPQARLHPQDTDDVRVTVCYI